MNNLDAGATIKNNDNEFKFKLEIDLEHQLCFSKIYSPEHTSVNSKITKQCNDELKKYIAESSDISNVENHTNDNYKSCLEETVTTQNNLKNEDIEELLNYNIIPRKSTGFNFNNLEKSIIVNNIVEEHTHSCVEEFNNLLKGVRTENVSEHNSKMDLPKVELIKTFSSVVNVDTNSDIDTWLNIYESFVNDFSCTRADVLDDLPFTEYMDYTLNENVLPIKPIYKYEVSTNDKGYNYYTSEDLNSSETHESQINTSVNDSRINVPTVENKINFKQGTIKSMDKNTTDSYGINTDHIIQKLENYNNKVLTNLNQTKFSKNDTANVISIGLGNNEKQYENDAINSSFYANLNGSIKDINNIFTNWISNSQFHKKELNFDDVTDYDSSDFEFIDEEEAKKDGLFYLSSKYKEIMEKIPKQINVGYFQSVTRSVRDGIEQCDEVNHIIPDSNKYVRLFMGNCPQYPLYCFENKRTNFGASMNARFKGLGCNIDTFRDRSSPEQRREAKDTEEKILSMYPFANKRRRT